MSNTIKPVDEIIVSAHGWTIVSLADAEEDSSDCQSLWRTPVIAWLVQLYRRSTDESTFVDVVPVSVNGGLFETQDYALQYRDRPPFITTSEEFENQAALLVHFNHRRAMRRATSSKSRQPETGKAAPARHSA